MQPPGTLLRWNKQTYEDLFFDPVESVSAYLWEVSEETFDLVPAYGAASNSVMGPFVLDTPSTGTNVQRAGEAIVDAANSGVDFSDFDADGDGTVTRDELLIVMVDAGPSGTSGQATYVPCTSLTGVSVCPTQVALVSDQSEFMLYPHEISHTLGTTDIYGDDGRLNARASLMGPSVEQPIYQWWSTLWQQAFQPDPWHKMRLGWVRPRVVPMDSQHTLIELAMAGRHASDGSFQGYEDLPPVIVYNPNAERPNESFWMVEYRGGSIDTWDAGSPDDGVVIWEVKTNEANVLLDVADFNESCFFVPDPTPTHPTPTPTLRNWCNDKSLWYRGADWEKGRGDFHTTAEAGMHRLNGASGGLEPDFNVLTAVGMSIPTVWVELGNDSCHDGRSSWSWCTPDCPCSDAEAGDCDSHEDCADGLICMPNIGASVGQPSSTDICVDTAHEGNPGGWSFCAPDSPCGEGVGDCDTHADCNEGLVCRQYSGVDLCERP